MSLILQNRFLRLFAFKPRFGPRQRRRRLCQAPARSFAQCAGHGIAHPLHCVNGFVRRNKAADACQRHFCRQKRLHCRTAVAFYAGHFHKPCHRVAHAPASEARAAITSPIFPATTSARASCSSVKLQCFFKASSTPGSTPAAPAVGAATILPMAALHSLTARA